MTPLSVVIITLNEEQNILRCIRSVEGLADEVVVVDSGSADRTAAICESNGCRVISRKFEGYGKQKQFAADQARNPWILALDADECLTPELREEIRILMSDHPEQYAGYFIPRSLVYLGRVMKHSGTGKEKILRLFHRDHACYNDALVHEKIIASGKTGELREHILHYSYRDLAHHLAKTNEYTSHAAQEYIRAGKSFHGWWVALKFPVSFITFYFFKGGILDRYPGFMWSLMAAVYGSMKIAKTLENQTRS